MVPNVDVSRELHRGGGGFPELIDEASAPTAPRIYAIEAAMDILGVSRRYLFDLLDAGELRRVRQGKRVGVREDDLHAYIERHTDTVDAG